MPYLLIFDEKLKRMNICKNLLEEFKGNRSEFGVTLKPKYSQNNKLQKVNWLLKSNNFSVCWESITTGFWDSRAVIFTDDLEKGENIPSTYYLTLLDKKRGPHLVKDNDLFYQDNAA